MNADAITPIDGTKLLLMIKAMDFSFESYFDDRRTSGRAAQRLLRGAITKLHNIESANFTRNIVAANVPGVFYREYERWATGEYLDLSPLFVDTQKISESIRVGIKNLGTLVMAHTLIDKKIHYSCYTRTHDDAAMTTAWNNREQDTVSDIAAFQSEVNGAQASSKLVTIMLDGEFYNVTLAQRLIDAERHHIRQRIAPKQSIGLGI